MDFGIWNFRRLLPLAFTLLLLLPTLLPATAAPALPTPAAGAFRYQNPITSGIDPRGLRDCQVFRDRDPATGRDKWFLTGTAHPVWPREDKFGLLNPGVVLYSSDDLIHWKFERVLVRPNPDKWYFQRFWAPEIHRINNKYYLTFNCRNDLLGDNILRTGYAIADTLHGPYRPLEKPLAEGNDLTLYQDDDPDRTTYAIWNATMEPGADRARVRDFGIAIAKIDLPTGRLLTAPVTLIRPGPHPEWDSVGIEGAHIIKRNNTYYLFYSSWTRGYEIGYATAPAITGPWTKHPRNPLLGGQTPADCRRNKIPYTGAPDAVYSHIGHNAIFTGPDDRLWLSCHAILRADPDQIPMLLIDPLDFAPDGAITTPAPTSTPQTIPLPKKTTNTH